MFSRIYLHIPFCRRKCPYCAFYSCHETSELANYPYLLLKEMGLASQLLSSKPLESIYFGGGTPSLLEPEMIAGVVKDAERIFGLADHTEITLEANPGTINLDRLRGFRRAGINRLSLGVQSLDDVLLETIGRIHTSVEARVAFAAAREAGFDNIGIDLIHGLPGQSIDQWSTNLHKGLELSPDHISIYGLTIEEQTPFAERYSDDSLLPDDETSARMFELTHEVLTAKGYEHYEIANYARPGRRSRHNSGYWQGDGYLGLGAGAHSFLLDDDYGTRFTNPADREEYRSLIEAGTLAHRDHNRLSAEDGMAEFMFLGLRMADGVDLLEFERRFNQSWLTLYGRIIDELQNSGLITQEGERIKLTLRGMLLSNQVFMRFLL